LQNFTKKNEILANGGISRMSIQQT